MVDRLELNHLNSKKVTNINKASYNVGNFA